LRWRLPKKVIRLSEEAVRLLGEAIVLLKRGKGVVRLSEFSNVNFNILFRFFHFTIRNYDSPTTVIMSLPTIHSKHHIDYLIIPYQGKVDILWSVVSGNMGK
jgi:hypothetical protein